MFEITYHHNDVGNLREAAAKPCNDLFFKTSSIRKAAHQDTYARNPHCDELHLQFQQRTQHLSNSLHREANYQEGKYWDEKSSDWVSQNKNQHPNTEKQL